MRTLVTGGAGFIGSHVADALVEEGHTVHVVDDLSSGRRAHVPDRAELFVMDVREVEVTDLIEEEGYDLLVHHAAQMDVRRSVEDPLFDASVNLGGFLNLIEAARSNGLRKVVFASTGGAIYGEPEHAPQREDHPLRPVSPYGITKLTTEKYLEFYRQTYGIEYVALRYGNVYGPRQNPHGEAGVVAIFTREILEGGQPIINGPGEQTRDYTYVGDVVRANLAAVDYGGSGVFNVGTANETSVNELFRLLNRRTDRDVPEQHGPAQPGEQQRSVLSYEKIRRELGWRPSVSLEEGLERTVSWFEAQLDRSGSSAA